MNLKQIIKELENFMIENNTVENYEMNEGVIKITLINEILIFLRNIEIKDQISTRNFEEYQKTIDELENEIERLEKSNVLYTKRNSLSIDLEKIECGAIGYMTDRGIRKIRFE